MLMNYLLLIVYGYDSTNSLPCQHFFVKCCLCFFEARYCPPPRKKHKKICQNVLTTNKSFAILIKSGLERCPSGLRSRSWKPVTRKSRGFESHSLRHFSLSTEYAAERSTCRSTQVAIRGSPAKGVDRETGARVRIPPSAPSRSKLCIACSDLFYKSERTHAAWQLVASVISLATSFLYSENHPPGEVVR